MKKELLECARVVREDWALYLILFITVSTVSAAVSWLVVLAITKSL